MASQIDSLAKEFVADGRSVLLTPRDVCTQGWRLEVGALERSFIVADGVVRCVGDITGVLNMLPYVCEEELVTIESDDRAYVAAEVTALLFYFLSALTCPIVNRPTAECLTGPGWRHEQWTLACRRVGIPTGRISGVCGLVQAPVESAPIRRVTVLGHEFVEGQDLPNAARVFALAELAHVTFLQVNFTGEGCFHSVQITPQLHCQDHRSALTRFFGLV